MHIRSQIGSGLPSLLLTENGMPTGTGRLRVLHVLNYMGRGGTEMVVLKLLDGLGDNRFEQHVCATRGLDADFARTRLSESQLSDKRVREKARSEEHKSEL